MDDIRLIQPSRYYAIDWAKVKTIEDMVTILMALDIQVGSQDPSYERLKPWLKEDTP